MRAVIARELGPPDALAIEDVPIPQPAKGEIRIAVRAACVGFVDALITAGRYQLKPDVPFIPGFEFAGVVDAVGHGVASDIIGARVCATAIGGGFSEFAVAAASSASIIPTAMSFEDAAVFRSGHGTAYYALVQRGRLAPGEIVLVLGAGGAVGLAAVQVAKALGAYVVASASSAAKREMARQALADAVVDSAADDWRAQVKSLTGGRSADIILDPVGGDATEQAFRSLAWNGRHLVIGFAQGDIPRLPTNLALVKGAALVGVDGRQFEAREPATAADNMTRLFVLFEHGAVRPQIGAKYALADFRAALFAATDRSQTGRIVLVTA
ncbi:NADPH:quinone oxidoreductase family protein [Terricaulis silvestris]|uniref:Quinone oxidoreductase 1 n=1 Tax=Terricaulis silvestris TaxID=2686094 RepID=A0A6I6MGI5_9CAUL|nr:NADPH:quinone oxidoreductase family protein [Terricaulis silvestris]QGZ93750.1 Quinone oxidoreductase 1 [Terricaulis silvestris]